MAIFNSYVKLPEGSGFHMVYGNLWEPMVNGGLWWLDVCLKLC